MCRRMSIKLQLWKAAVSETITKQDAPWNAQEYLITSIIATIHLGVSVPGPCYCSCITSEPSSMLLITPVLFLLWQVQISAIKNGLWGYSVFLLVPHEEHALTCPRSHFWQPLNYASHWDESVLTPKSTLYLCLFSLLFSGWVEWLKWTWLELCNYHTSCCCTHK